MPGLRTEGHPEGKEEEEKEMREVIVLVLAGVFIAFGCPDWLASDSVPMWQRALAYQFFHANVFHWTANVLSIWLIFRPGRPGRARLFVLGFIIALLVYPLASRPVVGISNLIFAVVGLGTPEFSSPWWRRPSTITFLSVTLLMLLIPQFSAVTHIASFVAGVLVAAVTRYRNKLDNDARRAGYR